LNKTSKSLFGLFIDWGILLHYLYPIIPCLFGHPHWLFFEEEQPAVIIKPARIRTNNAFLFICCILSGYQVKLFSENFIVFV